MELEELAAYSTSLFHSIVIALEFASTSNSCGIFLLLADEEEDEELIVNVLDILNSDRLVVALALQLGNQYPPPRQNVHLFPDFTSSNFTGRDVFGELRLRPWLLYRMTGETVQSLLSIVEDLRPSIESLNMEGLPRQRIHHSLLSLENRILVVFIWLWRYPSSSDLSTIFLVSPTVIERNIHLLIPLLRQFFRNYVRWPSDAEWLERFGRWDNLPGAVRVIDGTLHEIFRPITEPQELYYSGRSRYHCFSTQIVTDNEGNIVFVKCGFHGRMNDAGQWEQIVPPIGQGMPLSVPPNTYLLADKGYPNESILTANLAG